LNSKEKVLEWTAEFENRLKLQENSGLRFRTEVEYDPANNVWLPKIFVRHNGVDRGQLLPYHFLVGLDYKAIAEVSNLIVGLLEPDAYLMIGENRYDNFRDFGQVYDILIKIALRGIDITRFKGLGEMNPDELYDTTMDPENRVFLKVTIDDAIGADKEFSKLMGDVVEPRRDFIVANSHLAELDV
jgi:DNA gyrase subunit B